MNTSSTAQWPAYKQRQAQMAEAIELIRALWSGEKITYKGVYYQTRQAKLYTRPRDPIPLYVSSLVPTSGRFAGAYGDGLVTVGGEEPETYREILQNFEAGKNILAQLKAYARSTPIGTGLTKSILRIEGKFFRDQKKYFSALRSYVNYFLKPSTV